MVIEAEKWGKRPGVSVGIATVWFLFCSVGYSYSQDTATVDLGIVAHIESSGNPSAVGDGGKALGLYQLHKGPVLDMCRREKVCFTHREMLHPGKARIVANWYLNTEIPRLLKHYQLEDTLENRLIAYNAGIGNLVRRKSTPQITKKYLKKYQEMAYAKNIRLPGLFLQSVHEHGSVGSEKQGVSDVQVRV